jgi:hypothetical protein
VAGVKISQHLGRGVPSRRYGSFAGKPAAAVPTIAVVVGIMATVVDTDAAQVPKPKDVGGTFLENVTMDDGRYARTHDRMDLKSGDTLDRPAKFDVRTFSYATCEITIATGAGTWGSAVVTLRRSNDNVNFADLETPITFTAAAMKAQIDVRGFAFIAAVVTTYQAASCTVNVDWYGYS